MLIQQSGQERDRPQRPGSYPEMVEPMQHRRRARPGGGTALAQALGWFSVGLGCAELIVPEQVARVLGVRPAPRVLRALGVREVVTGLGILSARSRAGWLWARVGGDLVDLALLGSVATDRVDRRARVWAAVGMGAGLMAIDLFAARRIDGGWAGVGSRAGTVTRTITINRPRDEVYDFWRRLENLPRFLPNVEEVRQTTERRSRWSARGPGGTRIEWEVDLVQDRRPEWLAWWSLPGSPVDHVGMVRFGPGPAGRGTILRVEMEYLPPAGRMGRAAALLIGRAPEQELQEGLRRLKQLLEAGEIPTTRRQPSGQARSLVRTALAGWRERGREGEGAAAPGRKAS